MMALRKNKTVRETPTGQNLPHSMCPKPPAQCLAHSSSINICENLKKKKWSILFANAGR